MRRPAPAPWALLAVALATALTSPSALAGEPSREFEWLGPGGCQAPLMFVPTEFENLAPWIPPERHERMRTPDGRALLVFIVNNCPYGIVQTATARFEREQVVQILIGVGYVARLTGQDVANQPQFYLLASLSDWAPWAAAEHDIGLPAYHVPIAASVQRDAATGLGSYLAEARWAGSPLTIAGTLLAFSSVRELDEHAVHYHQGRHGFVRVLHDEAWAPGNEVVGRVTATDPGSPVARWMGATSREGYGIHVWVNDDAHVHRYSIVPDA